MSTIDYHWTIENGLAVLHQVFHDPLNYTLESLNDVVNTIRAQRTDYATPIAWQRHLSMYQEGLTLLELHTKKP